MRHYLQNEGLASNKHFHQCLQFIIYAFLQYGIIVWGQTSALYSEPMFKLQRKALRAISHEHPRSHTLPIFEVLKLLGPQDVFQFKMLSFVFKSIDKMNPMCFQNVFACTSSIHEYHKRYPYQGDVFLAHTDSLQYGLKSIRSIGAKLWNDLPIVLRIHLLNIH